MHKMVKWFVVIAVICLSNLTESRTVGSNALVARQKTAYFKANEVNNLLGFSVFEGDVYLQNDNTVANVDLFFPMAGSMLLNNGSLTLQRDISFKSPFSIGSGLVDGGSYAIEFPRNVSYLELPTAMFNTPLHVMDQETAPAKINSIDWSFDDQYIAVGTVGSVSSDELLIYYFDGASVTVTASYNFSNQSVNSVAWHPTDYYLAVGNASTAELSILLFDPVNGMLNVTDTAAIGVVNAVAWHPTGTYVAVGQDNDSNILVYPVSNGILGSVISGSLGSVSTVANNALAWDATGNYLAMGLYKKLNLTPELLVYQFDGIALTQNASVSLGQNVYAVAWQPDASRLSAGLSGTSENMRLYAHDGGTGTLTEIMSARINELYTVYALEWDNNGTRLASARLNDSSGFELKIWAWEEIYEDFILTTGFDIGQTVESLAWSHTGTYIAAQDRANNLYVFDFAETPLIFDNARLFFGSDVILTTTVIFEGVCVVNASMHAIDLTQGAIAIAPGGFLTIEYASLRGVQGQNLYCMDDNAILSLRGVTVNLDDNATFTLGSLLFKDTVTIAGEDFTFSYQSTQTSTIAARSELILDEGLTFDYNPANGANNLIQLEANTSEFTLNGAALHIALGGLQLLRGKMVITQDAYLATEFFEDMNEGITFGDSNPAHDIRVDIKSGQTLHLTQGRIRYKNVNQASLRFGNLNSSIYLYPDTSLYIYQNMFLDPGFLTIGNDVVLGKVIDKDIFGSVRPLGRYFTVRIAE